MLNDLYNKLGTNSVSVVVISVALMLFCGFLTTRLTKLLRLPNVTAYILTGIVIGPFCLDLIPSSVITGMEFISDVALAFIAFGAGQFFRISAFKGKGKQSVVITITEALAAFAVIFVLTYFILRLGLSFSLILASLASATAPASTLMTIRQTKAHGPFVDTLLSVVALDDVVALLAFSIAVSAATALNGGSITAGDVLLPIACNLAVVGIGALFGFLLKLLMAKRSTDNRLIVSVALLFAVVGIGAAIDVSPLLGCMAMGMVYINASNDDKLFKQLNYFSPPILLLFFVRSGLSFNLKALTDFSVAIRGVPLIVVGILYFFVRIIGKYAGALLGCVITKKEKRVKYTLGLALIPQAGVAIGLSAFGARILGGETGAALSTVILSSSILYELVGPALAKLALYLSGSYGKTPLFEPSAAGPQVSESELLRARLAEIEREIAAREYARDEDEAAFTQAAEAAENAEGEREEYPANEYMRRYKGGGRTL